jgi:hypothetical protein
MKSSAATRGHFPSRNKMEDGFLRDCLVTYIEKEIDVGISTDAIIDEFEEAPRRVDFN